MLEAAARAVLGDNWDPLGYTVPSRERYPFQWLWDSCFHAIAWAALGEGARSVSELRAVFAHQHPSGFVPHIGYQRDPSFHADFWGRPGSSTITQPAVYGHTIAELRRRGVTVPDDLEDKARRGLAWLFRHRLRDGRLFVVHPWESGCDDSPEFDAWCDVPWTRPRWYERKLEFVRSLELDANGAATANPAFEAPHLGFTAIAAFSADELGVDRPAFDLAVPAAPVALAELLGGLVTGEQRALALAVDHSAFGGPFGPASVHRGHPAFRPGWYWRGSVWPQLTYLLYIAAGRHRLDGAGTLAAGMAAGTTASGFAEHWHADTGRGLGASHQAWTSLVAAMG